MKTLLDASETDKLSPSCKAALAHAAPDTRLHILLKPAAGRRTRSTQLSPEPIDDAIRSAGDTFGQGPKLLRDLQTQLDFRSQSLRLRIPEHTDLWLADALAVTLPAEDLADLSHRDDVRWIDLQASIRPARRCILEKVGEPDDSACHKLHLDLPAGPKPRIGLVDVAPPSSPELSTFAEASFDPLGRSCADPCAPDLLGQAWHSTLDTLIPDAHWLRANVFSRGPSATFAQIVSGLQWTLEQGADLVIFDLGEAALDPSWHLPLLNCTLNGTSVVIAGMERNHKDRELWPVHIPLAGCYDHGPLRTDLLASGATLGRHGLKGSLAAAARAAAAIILVQTVAPKLKNDPAALVGPLFAGPKRGLAPRGEVELDPASILKAISSAA